ncbi:MAG: MlrC C-terminal domain-containing protein, partial [Alphaproteobacteria bacterium]|nr:MlrC C-terminal domain-containing protein [Alphaproteobacteria bacterium]
PVELFTAKSALDRAAALVGDNRRPVVILEHADRANDSTHVLHEALASGIGRIAVPYLCDPIAAKAAASAGVGNQLMTTLGGKSSELAGGPVLVSGIVRQAGPVRYRITGDFRKGAELDLGLCAVIDTGAVTIIVTTQNVTAVDTDPFSQFGLDIDEYDIIVLRSKTHFRAAYEPIAADILIADTPDWGPADLTTLPYRNAPPGIFPITV